MLRDRSIRRSTTLAMLAVGLCPLLILFISSIFFTSRRVEREQLAHDSALAKQIAIQIQQVISSAVNDLEILATNPVLLSRDTPPANRRAELTRLHRGGFYELTLLDKFGFNVETTARAVMVKDNSPWFIQARDSLKIFVSAPHKTNLTDELLISIYIPVKSAELSETSVIKATLIFDQFGEILRSISPQGEDFMVLIDDQGNLLESTDSRIPLEKFNPSGVSWTSNKTAQGECYLESNIPYYFVTHPVHPPNQLDQDRIWTLGYFREPSGVMALMNYSYKFQALAALIGLLAASVMGWMMARRLTFPIERLQAFSQKIAAGNLKESVQIKSKNELGLLAKTMNGMVSDLQQSRNDLGNSLKREAESREKEVLLKEIHHRMRNNVQILTSLFRMRGRNCDNEEMKELLKDCESRIRTMGALHQTLEDDYSISDVRLAPYFNTLSRQLAQIYNTGSTPPRIEMDIPDITLGLDTALPCGLIINELLTNSLKYAFPIRQTGTIKVQLSSQPDNGKFLLKIQDNGIGFDRENHSDREGGKALGLKVVRILSEQMNGDFQTSETDGGGFTAQVTFKESVYVSRV